jgi:DUF4097 and DUF4098 domain-containing protein YvlB
MNKHRTCGAIALALLLAAPAAAQETASDKASLAFSDATRPGMLKVQLINGGITVRGYEGREVVVEATLRGESSRRRQDPASAGMKKLQFGSTGLSITEDNNVIEVETGSFSHAVDLNIQVPRRTSLQLGCLNDGDVKIENVTGDLEVENLNGSVKLTGIGGSAVVHAMNGEITVVFTEIAPDKPMSFSSMNGSIDVTLPATLKANVILESQNGDIYTDFDVKMETRAREPVVEDSRGKGGKYRVQVDKAIRGSINGGGPDFMFKTFNGTIYIRKPGAK